MVRTIFDTRLRDLDTEMKFALCKGRTEPTSVVARSSNSITQTAQSTGAPDPQPH
jgi:hypothetical protein